MPPIELDLPEIIPGLDQWGGKNTAALLTLLQAVNSTIASLDVRAGHLWSIHTDGTETDLGSLPVGPPGGVNKVANLQGDIGAQQLVDAIAGPLSAQIRTHVGPAAPTQYPVGTEYVWFKTDSNGVALDILTGKA